MTFLAFVLIGVWEFGQSCALNSAAGCYPVRDPLDLAVLAAAFAGGCTGFLWWNTAPAKIIMGDTGSLALGGAIAGLAATLRVELLLIPLGGLFVIITMSVLIQTGYFKISGGKRVFKMAPLHHHFELSGWFVCCDGPRSLLRPMGCQVIHVYRICPQKNPSSWSWSHWNISSSLSSSKWCKGDTYR
jgi:UDP-N-acetylmuramyl pentapeptide phosphotransferase/UDP-N-acetylglucosamine-1-phosphate transferase